jgi:integrase/recombinase XerD
VSRLQAGPPAFARQVEAYLRYSRALGRQYQSVECMLRQLGRYLAQQDAPDLNARLYESWRRSRQWLHANSRRKEELTVRRFCLYRTRSQPQFFVASADDFARRRPCMRPVIVEPEQIARMLAAADRLPGRDNSPLHAAVGRIATVLLYTSGLRSGELLRLTVEDLQEEGSVLRIVEAKFHKSRLVPLSETAQMELRSYLRQRAPFARDSSARAPLLFNRYGGRIRPYSASGLHRLIDRLFTAADVRDHEGRTPRVHDLRHSFAVQSLIRSYRNQGDPQSLLPKLSMYMGHVSIASTMHYLTLVPTLAGLAMLRFNTGFGNQILGERS